MKLLFYAQGNNLRGHRLQGILAAMVPKSGIELCETVAGLTERLRRRTGNLTLVVLCLSTAEEFEQILEIRRWLQDLRIILLLPDRSNDTLARGLTLRPRFLGFVDTDLSDIAAVLDKMLMIYGKESA